MTAARRPLRSALPGLLLLLGLAWLAYLPGLAGGFLFDDFINLPALGATGPVDDWPTFWRYITSGTADPTGRPMALLSFLLDARDWPADPAPFLRTNLLLHLLNGGLLFALLRRLGQHLDGAGARTDATALLATGLWLLHPLFVSTTLYIVQREAMLPATFVLLGLLAWLHGRERFSAAPRTGAAWMIVGIGLGTTLAVLSKANGVLLPMLAWVLQATVLRQQPAAAAKPGRWLERALLVLPSLAVLVWLLSFLPRLDADLVTRPWTIGQRLLTEPRILLDYLQLLAVPRVLSTGLYNDAYTASTGLMQPTSTLASLLVIAALVGLGFFLRRRAPAVAAALLFYFAGHLLESTVVPLELYFEHRNYLPAMLLFWPLARALCRWRAPLLLRQVAAALLLSICAVTTWQRAAVWGEPDRMALLWAVQNPDSSRAQATAATYEIKAGMAPAALQRLGPRWKERPHDLQLALNYANAACAVRGLTAVEVTRIGTALRNATDGRDTVHRWLGYALSTAMSGTCAGLDIATVDGWLHSALENAHWADLPGLQQDLHSIAGRVALAQGHPQRALAEFDRALAFNTTPDAAASQAATLASQGHYALALAHLDHYQALQNVQHRRGKNMRRVHAWVLDRQNYWEYELGRLRHNLEAEIIAAPPPASALQ